MLFILFTTYANASCRYSMVEQNGTYFAVKRILGELPYENQKIQGELKRGNNDVKIKNNESDSVDNPEETTNARLKVRYQSKNKKDVQDYIKRFCP